MPQPLRLTLRMCVAAAILPSGRKTVHGATDEKNAFNNSIGGFNFKMKLS